MKVRRHGISILYDGFDAAVDIILVHGLTGHPNDTWKHQQSDTCWPRDLIKDDIPHCRVLTYGYDADVWEIGSRVSQHGITSYGAALNGDLIDFRQDSNTQERPIIFVAHSLGGLVTQNALSQSSRSSKKHLQEVRRLELDRVQGRRHSSSGSKCCHAQVLASLRNANG